MDKFSLVVLLSVVISTTAWSIPYPMHRHRAPMRFTRFAPPPPPHFRLPVVEQEPKERQRPKRGHHDYDDGDRSSSGVTGPVHTFVKTDKNANYKWGVRHHVGDKFSS